MHDPSPHLFLRQLLLDRRALLGGLAASSAGTLLPAFGRGVASSPSIVGDPEDLAAAQRLIGLDFTAAQLAQAGGSVARQRSGFAAMRQHAVDWWTTPAFHFDPLPPGALPPPAGPHPNYTAQPGNASTKPGDLAYASIPQLAGLLRQRTVTSRQLTELCIARLRRHDPQLLCVVTLLERQALAAADRADQEIAAGRIRGLLHGIPYGAKDLFAWPGAPTTFGAAPFKGQVLGAKATVLERLERAGAVLVAKLSLGALAMGDVWFGGRTRNPWNPAQGSSGSSAGPAAAVAAGLLPFALGSETCGSIVSPCQRCGVAGLRPSFGLVSRHGAMPLSWTMDKVGPIARHATDLGIVFDAIRGPDGRDASVRAVGFPSPSLVALRGLRVGVLDDARRRRRPHSELLAWLTEQGAVVAPARLPEFPFRALMTILGCEAATAFDDLTRSPDLDKLTRQDAGAWPTSFRAARFVPAVEYLRATRIRTQLCQAMHALMQQHDVLLGDSALPCTNLTGNPSLVLPCASGRGRGPASTAIIGRLFGEAILLAIGEGWQKHTRFHLGRPVE
ncbi:MAG: amidase [Planctomycetes bacterium]|nr:amidase [Planctomycetota bacterium]MCB9868384.1 amidase [Planctomycetota bacterium]